MSDDVSLDAPSHLVLAKLDHNFRSCVHIGSSSGIYFIDFASAEYLESLDIAEIGRV